MGLLSHVSEKYSNNFHAEEGRKGKGLLSHIREKYSNDSKISTEISNDSDAKVDDSESYDKEFLQKNVEENIKDCFAILYEINLSDLNAQENNSGCINAKEIAEIVNQLFPLPNVCSLLQDSVRAIYYCDEDFDKEMFEFHLKNTIENALGKSKADCFKYSDFCLTNDKEKVLSHVLG